MNLIPYTVFDTTTMLPKRYGRVAEELLNSHVLRRLKAGEDVVLGATANLREEQVVAPINGAAYYLRRRPEAEVDAARQPRFQPRPERMAVLLEALRAKGTTITTGDLAAAETRLGSMTK